MKGFGKYIWMSVGVALMACTTVSCSDFLEENPKGQLPSKGYFKDKSALDASLNALYSIVSASQASNNLCGTNFLAGDDISTHPSSNKQPLREHDQFSVADNNSWLSSMWEQRFKVIKAANFIINNAGETPGASEEEIHSTLGQAHYWRAFSYFYLVTTWGPVPVTLKEEIDYNAPLSSVEDIYSLIVEDLKKAEEWCPALYEKEPYGRDGFNLAVSEGAVKATMAYVYMCMAGWPMNKGAEYYRLAAQKAEEVIDKADQGAYYYKLLDEYRKVYSWEYSSKNPEVLLGLFYNRDQNSQAVPLTDILQDMKQVGWGDTNGEIKFWKEFPEGPRKEATYFPKIMLSDGKLYDWWYDTEPASREVVAPVFMKTVEGAVRGTEFDYTDPSPVNASGEKTIQVIRLSQVYCWYAEAMGRSGQVTSKAVEVLNRVRNRADGKKSDVYSMELTPEKLAEAAYNEHGWEIAGYYWGGLASRARDMFRMYRLKDHFEYRKQNPMIEVAPGVKRNEKVPVSGTWDDSKMYSPYPYEDAILNPNLHR